ncbi:hypothetical protein F5888DRAFT_1707028 [Russula emetica]|nr:hypothetical protein F5888DRAFT_1707028 [Russula emetica]
MYEYLLLLCMAVSSYVCKGVNAAAAVTFDTLLLIVPPPDLPFMEMVEASWLQIDQSTRDSLVFPLLWKSFTTAHLI